MDILRRESEGIEFFTVQTTGESGMSQSGLARMCGVNRKAINNLLNSVSTSSCHNFLKPLQDKELTLITSVHEFKNVTIIKDSVCAVILEWYAFESQRPTEKARQAFRQFAAVGIRTWIQSVTGWQDSITPPISPTVKLSATRQKSTLAIEHTEISPFIEEINALQMQLKIALKHRHAIHNIVEKPVAVDLSLNRIIHTAVHEQAIKLNQALNSLEAIKQKAIALELLSLQIPESQKIASTLNQLTSTIEKMRKENQQLRQVIQQQQVLFVPRRKTLSQQKSPESINLSTLLQPRIKEITEILMRSQVRKAGSRAIDTCTRKATIYARYEIGQSLDEIARSLQIPYETVKTYVKLTRADMRDYYSEQN